VIQQHIFFSPDAETGSSSSEPVKRLSSRYGIPEKDVEALLYGSRAPKREASGSDTKGKLMADEFRPTYNIQPPRERGWSPVTVLSVIVGILGIMALTIILIAVLHRPHFEHFDHMGGGIPPPPQMNAPNPPHPAMIDTASSPKEAGMTEKQDEVPPPAQSNEIIKKSPKKHHASSSHSSGFTTSNSMEAQEHLAEMRADGNTKAKIHGSSKNGVTIYNVK
jgi:hypothetical protein